MSFSEVRSIKPTQRIDSDITVPPSKSYTNRALIAASLAGGNSVIKNPSLSDDTKYIIDALKKFGIKIVQRTDEIMITGANGILLVPAEPIFAGNAGTTMRFLTAFSALAPGTTILTGDERMKQRPVQGLIHALSTAGINCVSNNGYPPVTVNGGAIRGGEIYINSEISSQYFSALLLVGPYANDTIILQSAGKIVSAPYLEMTLHTMRLFGAVVMRPSQNTFIINNHQKYIGTGFTVEGDASAATYFCSAAAITGGRVRITNIGSSTLQGDIRFLDILSAMGSAVQKTKDWVEVKGKPMHGIEIDMADIPDCVPATAVTAAFADSPTIIKNIHHLRYKESDRIEAIAKGLSKLGCEIETGDDWLKIIPKLLKGGLIETYSDHRIAMSFAVAGLKIGGVSVDNPCCVSKSYPEFWKDFQNLESR